ncbi:hypothetical protein NDA16_004693 [Ustilago loliicola]|nr:hypothetical protein NDA16_004693 [Ustilago loliicola]
MSGAAAATQAASPRASPERTDEVVSNTIVETETQEQQAQSGTQSEIQNASTIGASQDQAALAEEPTAVKAENTEEGPTTNDSTKPTGSEVNTEAVVTSEADGSASATAPAGVNEKEISTLSEVGQSETAAEQDDTDFVPPDMEHIVNTGATQDGAASMQALRELVAQARASSGQPRQALPPGFGDEEEAEVEASSSPPQAQAQAQRREKRKAEDELEELVQSSAGIDEVKAAAEKSQHPETKTLLQKALSSISGLVSRRPKVETAAAAASTSGASEQPAEQSQTQSKVDGDEAESSDESDSDSDSDSSSGDSSDDEDENDDARNVGLALVGDDDDDEEGGGPSGSTVLATKNEILAPDVEQPAVQELTDEEKKTMRKLGKVHSIVDSVVVVEQDVQQSKQANSASANGGSVPVDSTGRRGELEGEYSVLDTGSLLCFEDGKVLGLIFETFGSIHNPMYSIRFASAATIDRDVIKTGKPVFYLPGQSTYVMTQLLRSMKGSDASNMWDEEVAEDEIEYSDDEQEAEAKRRAKAIRSGKVDEQGNPIGPASNRGNKRQKQGAGQASSSGQHPSNGAYQQQQRNGSQYTPLQRPTGNASMPLPTRNVGGSGLPRPPVPAGPASLGPAFPHGLASLPPKPIAGLPSKPNFQPEASSSSNRQPLQYGNGDATPDSAPRSRMSTAEGTAGGQSHSRMHSAAASSLPAKPVDAAAAAAAAAVQQHRAQPSMGGASSPTQPSRPSSLGRAAHPPYAHQGSPGWYAGTGSAPSSTPASPAAPSRHASQAGSAYSPGGGAAAAGAPPAQGGHYNPAYAGHWQQAYGPGSASARSAYSASGMAWNAPQAYHSPPMHMAPGALGQQTYGGGGGYGGPHGGYNAPSGAPWNAQTYPGSHYPGYADPAYHNAAGSHANQGHYAPSAQAYGYGAYPGQNAGADPYNTYGYGVSSPHASAAAATATATPATPQVQADGYDPRSPLMKKNNQQS